MKAFCDGSARPTNPGPGGLAIVVCDDQDNVLYTLGRRSKWTTNNEQELLAILIAVSLYGRKEPDLMIYSDSAYAINCFTTWMYSWEKNGWTKSNGDIPENLGIIKEYRNLMAQGYKTNLVKVKGHAGAKGNVLADEIARGDKKPDYEL